MCSVFEEKTSNPGSKAGRHDNRLLLADQPLLAYVLQAALQDLWRPSSAFSLLLIDLFFFSDISLLQPRSGMSRFGGALVILSVHLNI
jgi:hypothetical protein